VGREQAAGQRHTFGRRVRTAYPPPPLRAYVITYYACIGGDPCAGADERFASVLGRQLATAPFSTHAKDKKVL
jgi:hypothetical protein